MECPSRNSLTDIRRPSRFRHRCSAPRETIWSTSWAHCSGEARLDVTTFKAWQELHMRSTIGFPSPGGSAGEVVETAKKTRVSGSITESSYHRLIWWSRAINQAAALILISRRLDSAGPTFRGPATEWLISRFSSCAMRTDRFTSSALLVCFSSARIITLSSRPTRT